MGTQFFWIFDAAVAAIFVGFIFIGIKKGFVSVLLSLLALILAFCTALFTSEGISEAIYDSMISDAITEEVKGQIDGLLGDGLVSELKNVDISKAKVNGRLLTEIITEQENIGKISVDLSRLDLSETGMENVDLSSLGVSSEEKDFSLVNLGMVEYSLTDVEKYGVDTLILSSFLAEEIKNGTALGTVTNIIETVTSSLPFYVSDSAVAEGDTGFLLEKIAASALSAVQTDNLAHQIADDIIRPVILVPMRTLIFAAIFVIIVIAVNLLAKLFKAVNEIPIIGGINRLFGAVAGFVQAAVVIFLVCIFVQVIVSITGNEIIFLNTMTIDETHVFKYIYYFDFLNFME